MKSTRLIINQVINLFEELPDYRDNRFGTIEYIVDRYYMDFYGKQGVLYDFKLLTDIDRIFRLVQQEIPALRGKEWLKRQMLSGEISRDVYNEALEMYEIVNEIKQLKLF